MDYLICILGVIVGWVIMSSSGKIADVLTEAFYPNDKPAPPPTSTSEKKIVEVYPNLKEKIEELLKQNKR